jgi:hypothetical protein
VAGICLLANINRFEILRWLVDERATYPRNPQLFSTYGLIFTWTPWTTLFFVLIARIKKGSQVKVGFYFLGTALPTVFLVGYLLLHSPIENYMNQEDFDAALWRNSDKVTEDFMWPHKLKMVDSLIESKILDDLNREEAIKLLGTPTSDFSPEYTHQSNEIYYNLGPERGFIRIDSEWLSISFDEKGKVIKYWLWRD